MMAFPLHDDNSAVKIFPGITWGIILLNVLVFFLWELPQGPERLQQSFFQWGVVPAEYNARQDLPPYVSIPYWGTLITMMFLHGGFAHLFSNMLYLWIFGDNVEQAFGHFRFLMFYLLCGIGATLFHIGFNPHSVIPTVGASGAISGVLAAYMLLFPHQKVVLVSYYGLISISALVIIGVWVGFQILNAVTAITLGTDASGIAIMAHLGGFIVGIPLTYFFLKMPKPRWVKP